MSSHSVLLLLLSAALVALYAHAQHLHAPHHKPPPSELAQTARWLMHESAWGVLATLSTTTGAPFGAYAEEACACACDDVTCEG